MRSAPSSRKHLALEVINNYTYQVPQALADIPRTGNVVAAILDYNVRFLDQIYALDPDDREAQWGKASNLSRPAGPVCQLLQAGHDTNGKRQCLRGP